MSLRLVRCVFVRALVSVAIVSCLVLVGSLMLQRLKDLMTSLVRSTASSELLVSGFSMAPASMLSLGSRLVRCVMFEIVLIRTYPDSMRSWRSLLADVLGQCLWSVVIWCPVVVWLMCVTLCYMLREVPVTCCVELSTSLFLRRLVG